MAKDNEAGAAEFKPANRNLTAAILKSALGEIPFAGSLRSELLSLIVPNRRLSRIESYLGYLTDRLEGLDADTLHARLLIPQIFDLLEEGAHCSIKAQADARRQFIAESVAIGIGGGPREASQAKRQLEALTEIDDDHIEVLLNSFRQSREGREAVNSAETAPPPGRNHNEQNYPDENSAWQLAEVAHAQPVKG